MTHRSNKALAAAALCTAFAATIAIASPAQAAQKPTPAPGAKYVALGSSYAAGSTGPADPSDVGGWCGRTTTAYPFLVAQGLGLELTNASCGGAKIENIATVKQTVVNQAGASHTVDLQLDAVTEETRLVTITIGGNDINYVSSLIAEACLGDLAINPSSTISNQLKQYGACNPTPDATVLAELATLQADMVRAIREVKLRAPRARIVIVDYLTVLPPNGKPCPAIPIPRERQQFLLGVARDMNSAMKRAAQQTGADFIAMSNLSRNHNACSSDPWTTGYDFSHGFGIMHPNEAGHAAVAREVMKVLAGHGSAH